MKPVCASMPFVKTMTGRSEAMKGAHDEAMERRYDEGQTKMAASTPRSDSSNEALAVTPASSTSGR